ncbi:MAG: hypothetical protein NVS3B1_25650 [Marmoricola sp.]
MTMTDQQVSEAIGQALCEADEALHRLDDVLAKLSDGDLHRAHRGGGWTVAQVISHINMSTVLWIGNLKRLELDPELEHVFREEVGHDVVGYPPPTIELARRQLASTRRTLATAVPAVSADVLARSITIPDLGTMTIEQWTPLIIGHAAGHAEQALETMRDRGFAPEGV